MKQLTDSEARAEVIQATFGPYIVELVERAKLLADTPLLTESERVEHILAVASEFSEFINTQTVCNNGCNHCCYQAVSVSNWEADIIGRHLGRTAKRVMDDPLTYALRSGGQEKYAGMPCSMLTPEGKCGIYEVRPMACRLHHSLELSEAKCVIGTNNVVGMFNVFDIHHALFNAAPFKGVADIREYFPPLKESSQ